MSCLKINIINGRKGQPAVAEVEDFPGLYAILSADELRQMAEELIAAADELKQRKS